MEAAAEHWADYCGQQLRKKKKILHMCRNPIIHGKWGSRKPQTTATPLFLYACHLPHVSKEYAILKWQLKMLSSQWTVDPEM